MTMLRLLFVTLLSGTVLAASVRKLPKLLSDEGGQNADTEGETDRDVGRIVGGNLADRGEYPWLIVLRYNGRFICGGSILDENTIITAAHCVASDPYQWFGTFSVKAGDYSTSETESTEQIIRVNKITMNNMYGVQATEDRDVAILKLTNPLTFGDYVKAIPFASKSQEKKLLSKGNCVVAGIGDTDNFGTTPNKVKEAALTIQTKSKCKKTAIKYGATYSKYMLCTMDENKGACSGDSGGPLMCFDKNGKAYQVGIVSFGSIDCWDGFNVFARVSALKKWINKKS